MTRLLTIAAAGLCLAACAPEVIDGDTFDLRGERIRIANIDAPELHGACAREVSLANAATRRLASLLSGNRPVVHREGLDRYGRTLARVFVDGRDVGAVLIRDGLASRWGDGPRDWC